MLKAMSALLLLFSLVLSVAFPVAAAPMVLFDEGHGQRFVPGGDGPLDLSTLGQTFRSRDIVVLSHAGPLTDASLKGVSALIISGAFAPLSADEIAAVTRFVEAGGALAAMLHIGMPLGNLLHAFGVDFSNGVIREQDDTIEGEPLNFHVSRLLDHPLFDGLDRFALYGGWALVNFDERSRPIATTGPKAWVDLNGDGTFSSGDVMQSYGVVVAGKTGAGRFVVFGDDAIFQNRFLGDNNRILATNLARWLIAE
ncbi:MAG: hypothetical protein A2X84_03105 [Desulfuromonadaceae bacterium GWC2_58_13]|nr:MAG: hypothetical protein A2X84_03105 [Desulfuromonadaceae bacterium GWC2_58_13]